MNYVEGDLIALALEGDFDVIVHGCNCFCAMEAGIALAIQKEFPEAYAADLVTAKGDHHKLGTFSHTSVLRDDHYVTIVNGYTQFHFQGEGILVDYEAVRSIFKQIRLQFHGKRIAYPKIGAGLAGGNWQRIAEIITEELSGEDHTLVICVK